ncbi:DUF6325 family protein [Rhodococcus erythropolis]|uniref:DUF6325 family protein n=1 Tax=Rhodococcus erythropolis TaxID=1833 RepID=UPI001BE86E67|nr:DUF6325 family protein [Rhodococcus erythropolis]MBT2263800.1 hypothetical protein [Rhodococcus erythropolis]
MSARFGPVDFYLLGLPGAGLDPAALSALTDLTDTGLVRLLDLIVVAKAEDGELTLIEVEELPNGFEISVEMLGASGLLGHDDITELAAAIPAGASALLVALELVYQRELAARTAESGAVLLGYERIPAPVVNALMDTIIPKLEV